MSSKQRSKQSQGYPNGRNSGNLNPEELTQRMAAQLEQLSEETERFLHAADHRARATVRRRPLTSVWTSFGVGVGVGLALVALLPSRDEPSWWDRINDSYRDLSSRARHLGRNVADQAGHSMERLRNWQ